MLTLINLIGEQPIPNLLPILYLKPAKTIILSTPTTENIAKRIQKLTENCTKITVEPYDIQEFKDTVNKLINQNEKYVFNITGGTKIMSVALYGIALENKADFIYLQSEGKKSLLYIFKINSNGVIQREQKELPELINMDMYLHAHLPEYEINLDNQKSSERGFVYERTITDNLKTNGFEVACSVKPKGEGNQLEIDAVL